MLRGDMHEDSDNAPTPYVATLSPLEYPTTATGLIFQLASSEPNAVWMAVSAGRLMFARSMRLF